MQNHRHLRVVYETHEKSWHIVAVFTRTDEVLFFAMFPMRSFCSWNFHTCWKKNGFGKDIRLFSLALEDKNYSTNKNTCPNRPDTWYARTPFLKCVEAWYVSLSIFLLSFIRINVYMSIQTRLVIIVRYFFNTFPIYNLCHWLICMRLEERMFSILNLETVWYFHSPCILHCLFMNSVCFMYS